MTTTIRIPLALVSSMRFDLRRPHGFAFERVGFLFCQHAALEAESIAIGFRYTPIRDDQYIRDDNVGARFDSSSIREAMQIALSERVVVLHVHLHEHAGAPTFSRTDTREMKALIPCFVNVQPELPHGALVLSSDSACARFWSSEGLDGTSPDRIVFVGMPMTLITKDNGIQSI